METDGIAIVGMSGRFPGARDVDSFWENIKEGRETISHFPFSELELASVHRTGFERSGYVCARGLLDDVDLFDARFFGYLPRDVELMDPQQRIFLELCWEAIESAGYDTQRYDGAVGVFAGSFMNSYLLGNLCSKPEFLANLVESFQSEALQTELGNDKDYLATHVAFKLGLRGPALTLQTACSTSLVAVAEACKNLAGGHCDMALAGGVTIVLPQKRGYRYTEGSILSPDGHCRPFDRDAAGTVFSNGAGVVLLKRLADAVADGDTIHAVIRGYATNNDGSRKVNFTAPSPAGQAEVIETALRNARVDPRTIGYVETHGTATPVGDPIEVNGLTSAYRGWTDDNGFCALGSVKANIGHLDVAAGVTGLIKAALVVRDAKLPPSINYRSPNPAIDFESTPFYVNTELRDWPPGEWPRRAGVSAFGVGGTNAHLVIEQPPAGSVACGSEAGEPAARPELIVLSARTPTALDAAADRLARFAESEPTHALRDVAFTLQAGRRQFDHRRIVVAADMRAVADKLRQPAGPGERGRVAALRPQLVFMFPGQGSQYPGMGRDYYHAEPVFRDVVDRCADALAADPDGGIDLRHFLIWDPATSSVPEEQMAQEMAQTMIAQPAIFVLEIALARLLQSWGIQPTCLLGHSVGEFAAATLAGIFTLEDAVRLVGLRGRLMQAQASGGMLAVRMKPDEVARILLPGLTLAAMNAPEMTVVSGPTEAIEQFAAQLEATGSRASLLKTSHAFHSSMMEPAEAAMVAAVAATSRGRSTIEISSTSLGRLAAATEMEAPAYWGEQILNPVRFADAVAVAAGEGRRIFIEVGPRQALSTFTRQTLGAKGCLGIVACQGQVGQPVGEHEQFLSAIGQLWVLGVTPDWQATRAGAARRIPLPTYPFERKRFWVEPAAPATQVPAIPDAAAPAGPESHEAARSIGAGIHARRGSAPASAVEPGIGQYGPARLHAVIQRQLALMRDQVDALAGQAAAPVGETNGEPNQ